MEDLVRDTLLHMGVPDRLKGHPYLVYALVITIENPNLVNYITGELYPCVAMKFGTTPSRVERAIRHAIEVSFDRVSPDVIESYFGNTISYEKNRPTNAEFIARIANVIRRRMRDAA